MIGQTIRTWLAWLWAALFRRPVPVGGGERQAFGKFAEGLAADHLKKLGYRILERNVRFRHGELDIVALDGEELVVCEVKGRRSDSCGSPAEAIDAIKQHKLSRLAECYRQSRPKWRQHPCRFDAVLVSRRGEGWQVEVIRDAF